MQCWTQAFPEPDAALYLLSLPGLPGTWGGAQSGGHQTLSLGGSHRKDSAQSHRPPGPQVDDRKALMVLFIDREPQLLSTSEPLTVKLKGGVWGGVVDSCPLRTRALCPQLPSAPLKLSHALGEERVPEAVYVPTAHPGGMTKNWESTEALAAGDPRAVQVPSLPRPLVSDLATYPLSRRR